jgi:hypothetical protein
MAIVTRLGKGSKLTAEEMDNNLLSLESDISGNVSSITSKLDKGSYTGSAKDLDNAIAANVTLIASKLDKGAYTGTAKDLENAIIAAVTGASGISIVPTSPAPAGTGIASFTATQAGTYTNYGGLVVNANSFAVISRNATGGFSISQTTLDLTTYAKSEDINNFIILPSSSTSFLNIDSVNKTFSVAGATYLATKNQSYIQIPTITNKAWQANDGGSGIFNVYWDKTLLTVEIIKFSVTNVVNINFIKIGSFYWLSATLSGITSVSMEGQFRINNITHRNSNYKPFTTAEVISYRGRLSINTVNRTVQTTGRIFIVVNGEYIDISVNQVSTAWIGTGGDDNLFYIVLDVNTKLINIIHFTSYPNSIYTDRNSIMLGAISKNSQTGIIECTIKGTYILNGVNFPREILNLTTDKLNPSFLPTQLANIPTDFLEFTTFNAVLTNNLFNKETIVQGYYGTNGTTFQADVSQFWTSDFIAVDNLLNYKKVNIAASTYVYMYNASKVPISPAFIQSLTMDFPAGVFFVRVIFAPADINSVMFTLATVDTSVYIPSSTEETSIIEIKNNYLPESIKVLDLTTQKIKPIFLPAQLANIPTDFLEFSAGSVIEEIIGLSTKRDIQTAISSTGSYYISNYVSSKNGSINKIKIYHGTVATNTQFEVAHFRKSGTVYNKLNSILLNVTLTDSLSSYVIPNWTYQAGDYVGITAKVASITTYANSGFQGIVIIDSAGAVTNSSLATSILSFDFTVATNSFNTNPKIKYDILPDSVKTIDPLTGKILTSFLPTPLADIPTDFLITAPIVYTSNLFNKATIVQGYYGTNGTTYQADASQFWTSDFIAVDNLLNYKKVNIAASTYVYMYNASKVPISPAFIQSETMDFPAGVFFVRVIFAPADIDSVMFTLSTVDTSVYIPFSTGGVLSSILNSNYLPESIKVLDNLTGKLKPSLLPTQLSQIPIDFLTFTPAALTGNLFNKATIVQGYYGTNGTTYQANASQFWTSDFIAVDNLLNYKKVNIAASTYVYMYNANKTPFSTTFIQSETMDLPEGVFFVRVIFAPADIDKVMFTVSIVDTSVYIPFSTGGVANPKINTKYTDVAIPANNIQKIAQSVSDLGALDYQEFETNISHVLFYGQSLSMGWEADTALTTTNYPGTLMLGDRVWSEKGNTGLTAFNPLVATYQGTVGESPAVAATNSFKILFDRFHRRGGQVEFLATNCGEGGKSVEQLSKNNTNGTVFYNTSFFNAIDKAKIVATGLGKTISCPIIVYMQGEHNYAGTGLGLTSGTEATRDKTAYKALLLALKNDMQTDIMAKYGQTKKPLFYIYQTAGSYINREDMSINMGQSEFAYENEDVVLLNPTYGVPDYGGGHLSTNGYRWYGELIAKSLYNVFLQGKGETSMSIEKTTVIGNKIYLDVLVPAAPMVIDIKTTPIQTGNGFKVRINGVETTITDVSILDGTQIVLTCSTTLTGTISVAYAGVGRNGSGNFRDSDKWISQYKYADETSLRKPTYTPLDSNGINLYGKRYPMYNWLNNFYKEVLV